MASMSRAAGDFQWPSCRCVPAGASRSSNRYSALAASVFLANLNKKPITPSKLLIFAIEGYSGPRRDASSCQRQSVSQNENPFKTGLDSGSSVDHGLLLGLSPAPGQIQANVLMPCTSVGKEASQDTASGSYTTHSRKGGLTIPQKVLRVAVDVDEVLGSFLSSLNKFIVEQHSMKYNISEYHVYDFMKIWGCTQSEANDRVHAFFESVHFEDGILPIPGAVEALSRLADFCDLIVVTSRQHVIKNQTLEWIERHYSGIFTDVYFGNHFALAGDARPKSEICRSTGSQILIDDNPRYAMDCALHGIEVLLFDYKNSYPWSKTADGPVHPLITRVQDWQEIENSLFARAYERN